LLFTSTIGLPPLLPLSCFTSLLCSLFQLLCYYILQSLPSGQYSYPNLFHLLLPLLLSIFLLLASPVRLCSFAPIPLAFLSCLFCSLALFTLAFFSCSPLFSCSFVVLLVCPDHICSLAHISLACFSCSPFFFCPLSSCLLLLMSSILLQFPLLASPVFLCSPFPFPLAYFSLCPLVSISYSSCLLLLIPSVLLPIVLLLASLVLLCSLPFFLLACFSCFPLFSCPLSLAYFSPLLSSLYFLSSERSPDPLFPPFRIPLSPSLLCSL
jgi:hypothetical protein